MIGREACASGHMTGHGTGDAQALCAVIGVTGTARAARSVLPRLCKPQHFYIINPQTGSLSEAARTFYKSGQAGKSHMVIFSSHGCRLCSEQI